MQYLRHTKNLLAVNLKIQITGHSVFFLAKASNFLTLQAHDQVTYVRGECCLLVCTSSWGPQSCQWSLWPHSRGQGSPFHTLVACLAGSQCHSFCLLVWTSAVSPVQSSSKSECQPVLWAVVMACPILPPENSLTCKLFPGFNWNI